MRRLAVRLVAAAALALAFRGASPAAGEPQASQADIHDLRGPMEPKRPVLPLLLAGGLAVAGAGLWRAGRPFRRTETDTASSQGSPHPDPSILLRDIRERLAGGKITPSLAATAAAELARRAVTDRTGIDAFRLTTGEILAVDRLPAEAPPPLALVLTLADRAKFAAHSPTSAEAAEALRAAQTALDALYVGGAP